MKDTAIKLTEATALAKASGLRNPRERILLAMLNDELPGERGGASWWVVRSRFEIWLEPELEIDRAEDRNSLRLPEARSLARLAGVEASADRVLQAVMAGEIENCQRTGAGWQIPRQGFEEWLDDVSFEDTEEEEEVHVELTYEQLEGAFPGLKPDSAQLKAARVNSVGQALLMLGLWGFIIWLCLIGCRV